jgi:hypothetical protein
MTKRIPEVQERIFQVLSEECSAFCMDVKKERAETARHIYEMLCEDGYVYLNYDDYSDHAEEERQRREEDPNY